jgi:N-glycosylase/DNA lyase
MTGNVSANRISDAIAVVARRIAATENQTVWRTLSEQQLWAELVGCILSSQVRHEACSAAHERLTESGLLQLTRMESSAHLCNELRRALAQPFTGTDNSFCFAGRYRFPNSKAKQIAATASRLYRDGAGISILLGNTQCPKSVRRQLIELCCGVGPKQASLFLRNIGFSEDVAILDAHVIRYMELLGLVERYGPSMSSIRLYEQGEQSFRCHAANRGFTPATLDTAVWVVMRMLSKEEKAWQS